MAWVMLEYIPNKRTYVLRVTRSPNEKRGAEVSLFLDRDVDLFEVGAHIYNYDVRHSLIVGHLVY